MDCNSPSIIASDNIIMDPLSCDNAIYEEVKVKSSHEQFNINGNECYAKVTSTASNKHEEKNNSHSKVIIMAFVIVFSLLLGTAGACVAFALQITTLKSEIASLKMKSCTSLEHQLNTSIYQQLSQQNSSINFVYLQLNTSIDMLYQQLSQQNASLDSAYQQLNTSLNEQLSQQNASAYQQLNTSLYEQLSQQNASLDSAYQQLNTSLYQQLSQQNASLDSAYQQLNTSLYQQLSQQNASLDSAYQQLNTSLNEQLSQQNASIDSAYQQLNTFLYQQLSQQNASLDSAYQQLNTSLNEQLSQQNASLDSAYQQLNTSLYEQLSQQNASIDSAYQQLNTSFNMVNKQLKYLQLTQENAEDNPATSCKDLYEYYAPSGYYWIGEIGSAVRVYCNMSLTCGNLTGGWMRVANIDMTNTSQNCPRGLSLISSPKRVCDITSRGCVSNDFDIHGVQYSHICGRVIGYHKGTIDAFWYHSLRSIDTDYVFGVSLTHGQYPRQHIWTFAGAIDETSGYSRFKCPCTNPNITPTPTLPNYIGNEYFCDTASKTTWDTSDRTTLLTSDPLWDGEGCGPTSTCCYDPQRNVNPPWFVKTLSSPTSDDIEMRLCKPDADGSTPIEIVELYVQ